LGSSGGETRGGDGRRGDRRRGDRRRGDGKGGRESRPAARRHGRDLFCLEFNIYDETTLI